MHQKNLGTIDDIAESSWISARHPNLRVERSQCIKKGRAAAGIKMSNDFIEQKNRCIARHISNEPRVSEYKPNQKRFLLAGRCMGGRNSFAGVRNNKIRTVGTFKGTPGGGIAHAVFF